MRGSWRNCLLTIRLIEGEHASLDVTEKSAVIEPRGTGKQRLALPFDVGKAPLRIHLRGGRR